MTLLLCDLPSEESVVSPELRDLGVLANYETVGTITALMRHLENYIPDLELLNIRTPRWWEKIGHHRVLNYTYGFGVLEECTKPTMLLEAFGTDYVGTRPTGLFLTANKPYMSALMSAAGYRTPIEVLMPYPTSKAHAIAACAKLPGDLLVAKPAYEESSLGLALVANDPDAVYEVVTNIQAGVRGHVLVQEYIHGVDVTLPIIGRSAPICLPPVALQRGERKGHVEPFVFDASSKASKHNLDYVDLQLVAPQFTSAVIDMGIAAFNLGYLRDYARLDVRLTSTGEIYFLEINANPQLGLGKASFARSADLLGLQVAQVVWHIVNYDKVDGGVSSPILANDLQSPPYEQAWFRRLD